MGKGWVLSSTVIPALPLTWVLVGRAGLEPATYGLKAHSSAN
jgi:hypothetical protein